MRILLDENLNRARLAELLRKAGHDVERTGDAGLGAAPDARVLIHAVGAARVVLTQDNRDFKDLHALVLAVGGHHPGILVVRSERDRNKDLTDRAIVTAVGKLEGSGQSVADGLHVLNHWR